MRMNIYNNGIYQQDIESAWKLGNFNKLEGSRILMKAKKSIFNDLVDWFGTDFSVLSEEKDWYTVSLCCSEDAMFLWAMQYNTNVEIIEPISLREKIGERAREMAEKYGK